MHSKAAAQRGYTQRLEMTLTGPSSPATRNRRMREFRLFKDRSGAFEILPVGWSAGALIFNMFWAIGNGVFWRFARYILPAFLGTAFGMFLLDTQLSESLGTALVYVSAIYGAGFVFYFATVAFQWRAEQLVKNGYDEIATIHGRTGREALNKWALSSDADQVLDSST